MNRTNILYFEDEDSKLHSDLPIVERTTINAILWNPNLDEFLCLDWERFGWKTFIIGGVKDEENILEAAIREIEEETGYIDMEFIANLGKLRSGYFATHKGENRIANTTGFLFGLKSDKQNTVENAVDLPHVFKWIPRNEVGAFLTLSSQKYLWDQDQEHIS